MDNFSFEKQDPAGSSASLPGADIKDKIKAYEGEILEKIGRLVQYNSVEAPALPGMPFGRGPADALKEALAIADELGFRTKNLDNYCGYAEMGEGPELIGIAGHLDIVPAGDGWTHDPFRLTREGDRIYGRGVTDDKGPVIESLYAMKLVRDAGIPLKKRVRLIFGCNEETNSYCLQHYNEVEEPVTCGFTPDANYPCIYGEKALMHMKASSRKTAILSMNGGQVFNAVCSRCTTVIPEGLVSEETLKEKLAETALTSFEVTRKDGTLTIFAQGTAAHASTPLLGVNAAGCTMQALAAAGCTDDFVEYYNRHIGITCDGAGFGLKKSDAYGELTLNNGIVSTEDGTITCSLDIRVPVTFTQEEIRQACAPYLSDEQGTAEILSLSESLFFPVDSPLVSSLCSAYAEVTGDTVSQPLVIGGGTYAKHLPGIIAFGPEMPGKDYCIHNADEFAEVPEILQTTEIYARAIEKLLAL